MPMSEAGFIPKHGGYQDLAAYQKARIVYDATAAFCQRFVDRRSRTHDQMIQAARSGKQNIVEGSMASATSKETEIKLMNVARASLEELLEDYRDFLRTRKLPAWDKNHPQAQVIRKLAYGEHVSYKTYETRVAHAPPEVAANTIICLIHQTNYLLDRLLRSLEKSFLEEGGLRERMTRARLRQRNIQRASHEAQRTHEQED
ncbi:MAG: four helix bundle protein [Armatimonadetes bacterium]|nr:four helix bundle protein [Armatimonadota bacterium]